MEVLWGGIKQAYQDSLLCRNYTGSSEPICSERFIFFSVVASCLHPTFRMTTFFHHKFDLIVTNWEFCWKRMTYELIIVFV